jgi:hypothetical protein
MASVIERHQQRALIDSMLVEKRPLREIGRSVTPPVSAMALHRYNEKHIKPTLEGVATLSKALQSLAEGSVMDPALLDSKSVTQAALAADPLLARIARHQATIDGSILDAQADKDGRAIASLIGTDLKGLELHARLTGRLESQQGPSVAIQIVCPAGAQQPTIKAEDGGVTIDIGPSR